MLRRIIDSVRAVIGSGSATTTNSVAFNKSATRHGLERPASDETHSGGDFISPRRRSSTARLPFTQWARINRTDRFVSVRPLSGYRIIQPEDDGYVIYLAPDVNDEALGRALLEALARSRFIFPPDPNFSEAERYLRCIRNWQNDFMRRYGYKTKRDAYKNMDWCETARSEGKISIKPHKRAGTERFRSLPPEETVVIPATDDSLAVGAALRLALDRCE
jgi:hypothetical protein